MGTRLLPRDLNVLFAHALALEGAAARQFLELERYMRAAGMDHIADEFESIGKEEREQYELLAVGTAGRELPKPLAWEYAPHFLGPQAEVARAPRNVRDALTQAIATERRIAEFLRRRGRARHRRQHVRVCRRDGGRRGPPHRAPRAPARARARSGGRARRRGRRAAAEP